MFDQLNQLVEQSSPHFGLHTLVILLILVGLEAVLSADNAIALASLVKGLNNIDLERKALDLGLIFAFVMRMLLIVTATWVIKYWQFELLGALYLLWLSGKYFIAGDGEESASGVSPVASLWKLVPLIAITDLAFSLDSVTTAIALADDRWLVITGGVIGILALRFLATLFIRWLGEYQNLQDAGYLTVAYVGFRLLFRTINESYVLPEWAMVALIGLTFAWGFSVRLPVESHLGADVSLDIEESPKSLRDAEPISPQ